MPKSVAESLVKLENLLENVPKEKLIEILGNWFNSNEFEEFNDFVKDELSE